MALLDGILDRSILFSFDRSGFERHRRRFDPGDLARSLRGQQCLVTGGNSGLGRALALGLAAKQARVHLLCRNRERGEHARRSIVAQTRNPAVELHLIDLSSLESIRAFAAGFAAARIDVLVHNAGVLPSERQTSPEGLELATATHLVGPFLLTALLRTRLAGARVIFVSSGGMYSQRLDVASLQFDRGDYDGVAAYAMTKRGQVVLSELWADELAAADTAVNAMHPGWAATPGVERSLPRFWRAMRHRLRTPQQGADTALWLAVAERVAGKSGKFWFDRRPAPTHLLPWTREPSAERRRLWDFCRRHAGLD